MIDPLRAPEPRAYALDIERLGPWFHNLHLPGGTQTEPRHPLGDYPRMRWLQIARVLPKNLSSWTVLDVGCNAGYFSFELARLGARVLAIDSDQHCLDQARWAAQFLDPTHAVTFRRMEVYDLGDLSEQFDMVLFMGVFYHLRYPLLGLDLVAEKVKRQLVFQTLCIPGEEALDDVEDVGLDAREALSEPGWPKMAFIERRLAGDPTIWWVPNHAGALAMLRASGMRVIARPAQEVYLCEPKR
jgi:tRNA (mo5U34)-methyltransferase